MMADDIFLLLFFLGVLLLIVALIKPGLFTPVLRGWATRGKAALVFGGSAVVFFVLFSVTAEPSSDSVGATPEPSPAVQEKARETAPEPEAAAPQVAAADYEIVKTEDQSHKALERPLSSYAAAELEALPVDRKFGYRVVVPANITEAQVRPTVEVIIDELTGVDPDVDEISLLLYSDAALAEGAYDVAMATWAVGGKLGGVTPDIARSNDRSGYDISLQVKKNLEEYLRQRGKSEDKFGLSEERRREIFKAIVAVEDRARDEADKLYSIDPTDPDYQDYVQTRLQQNADKNSELNELYKAQLRVEYGIDEETEIAIANEGLREQWPFE